MNYGDIRTYFLATLNRRDALIDPAGAVRVDYWLQEGIRRTQRSLEIPADEKVTSFYCKVETNAVRIPDDFLRLISISYQGVELIERDQSLVRSLSLHAGWPQYYTRVADVWFIGPAAPIESNLEINYHADFSNLSNNEDRNWLTDVAPQAIVDAALVLAYRFYSDTDRMQMAEASFVQTIGDINNEAAMASINNASMAPGIDLNPWRSSKHRYGGYCR